MQVDAAYCYGGSGVVRLSAREFVGHNREPRKNDETIAIWILDSSEPNEPRIIKWRFRYNM